MITITAKSTIKPGKKKEYLVLAKELVEASRKEKGCLSYNLYEDIENPGVFIVIEEWENKEDIQRHNISKHFTEIIPRLAELREGKPEINQYKQIGE